jgi:solute carrier family 9 (sodium/hydrogen exchanger), member 6/7
MGFAVGAISSLLFKVFRSLTHSPSTETLLLLVLALSSYFVSDALGYSGIIGLLTCGITMGHYTWYNLSPQGKTISSVTFTIFG